MKDIFKRLKMDPLKLLIQSLYLTMIIALAHGISTRNQMKVIIPETTQVTSYPWQKTGENFQVCYCTGFVCYYCPGNLYCTTDLRHCCPEPGCKTDCGRLCVCPSHPVCCHNDWTCARNTKCCGNDCCPNGGKCCKNDKEKTFCLECQKDTTLRFNSKYLSDISRVNTPKVSTRAYIPRVNKPKNSTTAAMKSLYIDDLYFRKVCDDFAAGTRKKSKFKSRRQFAAMTINELNHDTNIQDPDPLNFTIDLQKHNYVSSPPQRDTKQEIIHAEMIVIGYLDTMLAWFKTNRPQSQPKPPDVYLFTFFSPCASCSPAILNTAKALKAKEEIRNVNVAWQITYNGISQNDFLNGLELFIEHGIQFQWKPDGICSKDIIQPNLFQTNLTNCLMNDITKAQEEQGRMIGCCNANEVQQEVIKLVNMFVWKCKEHFPFPVVKERAPLMNCMNDAFTHLNPPIDACIDVSAFTTSCIEKMSTESLLLSPPLDPSKRGAISNSVIDLHGTYGRLCFQIENDPK